MNRYPTKSQKYDSCKNHPLFAINPVELAPNLPHEIDSHRGGNCGVPGCWHNKSTISTHSPAASHESIQIRIEANGKEGVKESSRPEVRMVELAVAGKRYRVVSDPDKVATAVFRLLGMPSPRRVTEVDPPPDTQEAAPA